MAKLSTNRIAWTYTADDGTDYRVAAPKAVTDQNKLGGSAAASTVPALPKHIKMRRLTVRNLTIGRSRSVPIYDNTAAILTPAATVNLNSSGLVADVYTEDSYPFANLQAAGNVVVIPEKHGRASPVTTQSA